MMTDKERADLAALVSTMSVRGYLAGLIVMALTQMKHDKDLISRQSLEIERLNEQVDKLEDDLYWERYEEEEWNGD